MRHEPVPSRFAVLTAMAVPLVAAVLTAAVLSVDAAGPREPGTSFRLSHQGPPSKAPATAPIELTASDGTGLRLVALDARGVLVPPLAFTELRLAFDNPHDRVVEGRFRIALPPGAVISRFAMEIAGAWQEGEVVERQRARRAYEDFLHRRQDPALLEHETGNEFSARVFPIPARGRKHLIVAYSHALPRAADPYVLPLLGLPEIADLEVQVLLGERPADGADGANSLDAKVSDRRVARLQRQHFTPDRDFVIAQDRAGSQAGLRHGNLAVVRIAPPVDAAPQEIEGLYVLVDTSASRAFAHAAQGRLVADLLAALRDGAGGATPVGIVAFDQDVLPIYEGVAGDLGERDLSALADRPALGASDLHRALAWLGEHLATRRERYPRVLLLTDGVATAGKIETPELKAAVRALGEHGVERLDVVVTGGLRDDAALRALVTGNLAHDGQAIDGGAPLAEITRRLTRACRTLPVEVAGASWVWPETLAGVQPGDEVLVYADLPPDRPLAVTVGGRNLPAVELAPAERPLLERQWVAARIDRLVALRDTVHAGDPDLRRALALQIVELSTRHRVLSPYTAFLVLETEADYVRFGLDRRALADILTVGPAGIEVAARSPLRPSVPILTAAPPAAKRLAPRQEFDLRAEAADDADLPSAAEAPAEPESVVVAESPVVALPGSEEPEALRIVEVDEPPLRVGDEVIQGEFEGGTAGGIPEAVTEEIMVERRSRRERRRDRVDGLASTEPPRPEPRIAPYTGRFAEVREHLAAGRTSEARQLAEAWSREAPGDVVALLALGEAWEAAGKTAAAARAYGSLIDLYPSRADLRRHAGERLEGLGEAGLELAIDTYAKAVRERPDHPAGHRLLAWALHRAGRHGEAFAALLVGLTQHYPAGRFAGVDRVLREDLGLLAAAWLRAEPKRREEVLASLAAHHSQLAETPSLRFVLTWETDANDVDLHVYDRSGDHAFYQNRQLRSGGDLYADVTNGYGPECFTVMAERGRRAAPYRLEAHYYSRGPMGYGMGLLQVVEHDGEGGITIEPRPFVVMVERATVELGVAGKGEK